MKKETKRSIKQEYEQLKKEQQQRKQEISSLRKEQQKEAKRAYKIERKTARKERKQAIKKLVRKERRNAKKHDKYLKKLFTRKRRYIVRGLLLTMFVIIGIVVAPIVGDISTLLSVSIDTDNPNAAAVQDHAKEVAEDISDEGIVLLKNEDNVLPLANNKINVFGYAAFNFEYGGGGSGGSSDEFVSTLFEGLNNAGIDYNETLYDFYTNSEYFTESDSSIPIIDIVKTMLLGLGNQGEPDVSYLTDSVLEEAKNYSDTALIVLSHISVETSDATLEELSISENTRALIATIDEHFENVIIVVNSGQAMELGFLEEFDHIDAALWVGTPGSQGTISLGNILKGNVNPSGRLTDTYVYDVSSHPSAENLGDYAYDNLSGMSLLEYEEGIYVGYRFFETYYQNDEIGYNNTVQFPFGYGLSYTTFDWTVTSHTFTSDDITLTVDVTNTGTIAGKDVLEVYFSAPYTPGGIEKSAIELAAYAKTSLLAPGETQTITITYATRDMSSYDMGTLEAYVLEAGTYDIMLSRNVHDPVTTLTYDVVNDVVYDTDEITGTAIENQFDYANGGLTYLSRNDWDNTYPDASDLNPVASQELIDNFNDRPAIDTGDEPTTGADNGILLEDLRGLDYDDPMWDLFLDQFTVDEMKELISNGAYVTTEIERLGIPQTTLLDGPAGISFVFGSFSTMAYPTEVVIASTWNDELAYQMGEAIGMEANVYGVDGWYAPGMNIHRTAQGGRNFEYYSEDPLLSGKISSGMVRGAQSRNILVFMKHFILNEQEINARSGVLVWANEQAIRELYLRPFEITVKEAEVTAVMSSFIHVGYKWSGGNPELLQNVLRDEWGFVGLVSTDAVLGSFMDLNLAIHYGNDIMLAVLGSQQEATFERLYKENPTGIIEHSRDRVKNICYAILEYTEAVD